MNGYTSCIPSGPPVVLKDCRVKDPGDVPFGVVTCIHESHIHRDMVDHISEFRLKNPPNVSSFIFMSSFRNEIIDF